MITNHDRSKWIGASDAHYVMSKWDTRTFSRWWTVKLGTTKEDFSNKYMEFGNLAEYAVVDAIDNLAEYAVRIKKGKRPRYIPHLRLRVNYDGILPDRVVEIKTVKQMPKKPKAMHVQQCQALMLGCKKSRADIWYYEIIPEEYDRPYYLDIDTKRLRRWTIERDEDFLKAFCKRLRILASALRKRRFPEWKLYPAES